MIPSQMVMKEKPRKSPRRPPTFLHPNDPVPDGHEGETKKKSEKTANLRDKRGPGIEYLLSFFGCSPSPGGEGHWEVRCLKTSWSLFCQQPVFVILAGPSTVGQRVYNWKLLEAHFGKEQLILMVLFN